MLNGIFVVLVLAAVLVAAWLGRMTELTQAMILQARNAVDLAIGLVGMMALFLGLMKVAERAGALRRISLAIAPVMRRLFPAVPPEHPAMSAMILNIAANMLGLTNAATPFGIKAMEQLDRLNGEKGTATNAMALFLAINTSAVAVLPSGVIAVRASLGSQDPTGIFLTTWFASGCATIVAIAAAFSLARLPGYKGSEPPRAREETPPVGGSDPASVTDDVPEVHRGWAAAAIVFALGLAALMVRDIVSAVSRGASATELARRLASDWALVAVVVTIVLVGLAYRVRVYDAVVEGAKEGFQVALRIIPYLVAILVAVGMFRASGALDQLGRVLRHVTDLIAMPVEVLPMALIRPLSGSGALGVMTEIMTAHGTDTRIGYMVSTMSGSTETTFYTLAVYFGAVGIRRTRHTVPACLAADATGMLAAVLIVNLLYG